MGGVGQAVLSLLQHSAIGRQIRKNLGEVLLIDWRPHHGTISLENARVLDPMKIESAEQLRQLIREHQIDQVVDLSSLDTLDCMRICEEEGADFLCTSVEEWPAKGSIPTDQAISPLLPPQRPLLIHQSHLVGSGANPGLVNALTFAAIEKFAQKMGVDSTVSELDLHSIFITEVDTTAESGVKYGDDVFPMTWSPSHCLEELFEPRAFLSRNGKAEALGHRPTEQKYRVRCGDHMINGWAVPHEETKTLARCFRDVDFAFVYQIPAAAESALISLNARKLPVDEWATHRMLPPRAQNLTGYDRLGVLLCSRTFGEFWMGFHTSVDKGLEFGTNATQLQVATGVLAGWDQLGDHRGIHFVENLDWRRFLSAAIGILGEPMTTHDPAARPLRLSDRRTQTEKTSSTEPERQYA